MKKNTKVTTIFYRKKRTLLLSDEEAKRTATQQIRKFGEEVLSRRGTRIAFVLL